MAAAADGQSEARGDIAASSPSVWALNREKAQLRLEESALALFALNGVEATTVAQICQHAGVSPRSFFRYYKLKEDVVMERATSSFPLVRERLVQAPRGLSPLQACRHAFEAICTLSEAELAMLRIFSRLREESDALRGRLVVHEAVWEADFATILQARLPPGEAGRLQADIAARAVITTTRYAVSRWAASGKTELREWLDSAFAILAEIGV